MSNNLFFENWKYWIANEVIEQLLIQNSLKISLDSVIEILDIEVQREEILNTNKYNFQQELESSQYDLGIPGIYINSEAEISDYYEQTVSHNISTHFRKLKQEKVISFRQLLSNDIKNSSPIKLIDFIKKIISILTKKKKYLAATKRSLYGSTRSCP